MQNIYIDIVATFDALPFRQGRVPTPCHFDKAECQGLAISTRQSATKWQGVGTLPCVLCQFVSMTKPVHESELGKAFWNNVRVENICCRLFETSDGEGPPEGALQMGPYVRPQNPLESSMTRTGRVCLQFHVKGSPESSVLQLKVGWTYVQHGQNRDSMLGKIKEPEVVQILALLKQLSIPSSERQSAEKLKCLKIAEDALSLLQGRVPNEKNPTDQVHIIVKLHRVKTREEKKDGWPDGNASDAVFLKGRRWTKYWRTFPQFLAFDEFALMTHDKTSGNLFPVTRRSVMVTEAKGDGTPLGKFISDRLANISRFSSEKETMQLVFKAFKFILQVQMHHLETEGAFLADLHEKNRHVRWEWGPFRRAVCLRGCFGAPDSQRASACEKRSYQSPFVVFLEYLVNCQSRQGPQESLVCLCDAGLGQDAKDRRRVQPKFSPRCWLDARENLAGLAKGCG